MDGESAHFEQLRAWLKLESQAEREQLESRRKRHRGGNPEQSGESLVDLVPIREEPGLAGRVIVTLRKRNRDLSLPPNRFRVGSPVIVTAETPGESRSGVVTRTQRNSINVSLDDLPNGDRYRLDLSADEVTRKRQSAALGRAERAKGRTKELRQVLLGERDPEFDELPALDFLGQFNPPQQTAIAFAMSARDVAIIHGPPGTGKTTTLVELILQARKRGETVLACAPSNTAVDNLVERLVWQRLQVVRLGHPARVDEQIRPHTLDAQVGNHDLLSIAREMQREATSLYRKAGKYTRAKPPPGAKQDMRTEAKRLKADARMLEQQAVESVLNQADVICSTTTLPEELLADRTFDLAVIDEACQITEPGCWIPINRARRVVLAGDHCQLPPTVISHQAAKEGYSVSLLERLVTHYGDRITKPLQVQYRMHESIMQFSSGQFYEGMLIADDSVAGHRLCDLPDVVESPLTATPIEFFDTAGADWHEEIPAQGESKRNPQEGTFILRKVRQLEAAGIDLSEIAVIAPYSAQVRWLRNEWGDNLLEIDTVDGFQGREKEAVLITCVRSNTAGEIGFLADTRRMNVALTRAKRKLIVVGDSSTLGGNEFYAELLAHFESLGAYRTIWEEPPEDGW